MWTRRELKERGKFAFHATYWRSVLVALIAWIIAGGWSTATATGNFGDDYGDSFAHGMSSEFGYQYYGGFQIAATIIGVSIFFVILAIALDICVLNPLEVGTKRFFVINLNRPAELNELGSGFSKNYTNTVKIMFKYNLYIFLWSLLFVIPGIVKSYEYRMVPYLLAENPNVSEEEAFGRSKQMMDGQKWRVFVLDLSFIGWRLLGAITFGIVDIFWTQPYQEMTNAALYERFMYGVPTGGYQGDNYNNNGYNNNNYNNGYNGYNNNGYNNNGYNSGYNNNGYNGGYNNNGYNGGYNNGGYNNNGYNGGYNNNGYNGGYNNNGYNGGYNNGYNGGYNNNGYNGGYNNGGYNNNGYNGGYNNNGYNGGYNNNGYNGGYDNNGYNGGYDNSGYNGGYNNGSDSGNVSGDSTGSEDNNAGTENNNAGMENSSAAENNNAGTENSSAAVNSSTDAENTAGAENNVVENNSTDAENTAGADNGDAGADSDSASSSDENSTDFTFK
jgi:uncharacterized membrane protein